jgi:hypothetical protein
MEMQEKQQPQQRPLPQRQPKERTEQSSSEEESAAASLIRRDDEEDDAAATQSVHSDTVPQEDAYYTIIPEKNATTNADYEKPCGRCFPVLSVQEWYNGNTSDQTALPLPLPLLDIRSQEEWEQWHFVAAAPPRQQRQQQQQNQDGGGDGDDDDDEEIRGNKKKKNITVVHIPLGALMQRSYELPPRKLPFCLLLSNEQYQIDVATSLVANIFNYTGKVEEIAVVVNDSNGSHNNNKKNPPPPPKSSSSSATRNKNNNKKMRQPWQVRGVILAHAPETLKHAQELGILVVPSLPQSQSQQQQQQKESSSSWLASSSCCFQPLPRLWEPDPMIRDVLLPLLIEQQQRLLLLNRTTNSTSASSCGNQQQYTGCCWEIWDLGAGSGRDACFLAEELKRANSVVAAATAAIRTATTSDGTMDDSRGGGGVASVKQPPSKNDKVIMIPPPSSFRVIAMDQRYRLRNTKTMMKNQDDDNREEKAEQEEQSSPMSFWKRRGVAHETECRRVDLENETEMNELLLQRHSATTTSSTSTLEETNHQLKEASSSSSLIRSIYAVRYWNRPLVVRIANDDACNVLQETGAIFAMCTFGKPRVGASWKFAHPKVKLLLGVCLCLLDGSRSEAITNGVGAKVLRANRLSRKTPARLSSASPHHHSSLRNNTSMQRKSTYWSAMNLPTFFTKAPTVMDTENGAFFMTGLSWTAIMEGR